ncbi:MAG: glycosyltransferase family 39 protein [Chloroflexi bacterium]|nr:glycosyltransferase family 39 protein [Chloroflexota bacterium]
MATGQGLPVLKVGDYDQAYLEALKAARFPPQMSIDAIRYESHQPPLYYLLAAPVYRLTTFLSLEQQVVALRLLSLVLGALLLVMAYVLAARVFPNLVALGTAAFMAAVPQHTAMTAAINNDTLAELVLATFLFLAVTALQEQRQGRIKEGTSLALGLTLGLALLTKTTIYIVLLLVPLPFVLGAGRAPSQSHWLRLGGIYLLGLGISGWWFLRNVLIYGLADLTGLTRHDMVVVGQPIPGVFDLAMARHLVTVGFKSFWVQLGWMGVPADRGTYIVFGLLSVVALLGCILFLARARSETMTSLQRSALLIMIATIALVFLSMLYYNLRYIQPQGRYLFPALVPLSLFSVLGLRELLSTRHQSLLFILLFGGLFLLEGDVARRLIPFLQ